MSVFCNHLERASASFSEALQVTSRESFPQDVAMMQQNLDDVYRQRVQIEPGGEPAPEGGTARHIDRGDADGSHQSP
ncbi:MAG TPA: hypothetical protein VKR06_15255 [Ktedonosporobacter sp.]|nr:hypothetical protein [Ktedonosporobacter sp.]